MSDDLKPQNFTAKQWDTISDAVEEKCGRPGWVLYEDWRVTSSDDSDSDYCEKGDEDEAKEDSDLYDEHIFRTKLGGYPYIPPTSPKSEYDKLELVFQLNCEDLTPPDFPATGLLQIFMCSDAGHPKAREGSVVLYWPKPDETVTLKDVKGKYSPYTVRCSPLRAGYCKFLTLNEEQTCNWENDERVQNEFLDQVRKMCKLKPGAELAGDFEEIAHQFFGEDETPRVLSNVGGVINWVQSDPIDQVDPALGITQDTYVNLLFLDSDFARGAINFGEMGTGCWLISKKDLLARNFDNHTFSCDSV